MTIFKPPFASVFFTSFRGLDMYLKKVDGPRAVTLPDGSVLTQADLPPKKTTRWVASRKATVVKAVQFGLIPKADALEKYGLSEEEFDGWLYAIDRFGEHALKATSVQEYRATTSDDLQP